MNNLLKNKTNLFLLAVAIFLLGIILIIAVINLTTTPPSPEKPLPTPVQSQTPRPTVPVLDSTVSPSKQGVFTVTFPIAPDPDAITITLDSSTLDPASSTKPVPFTTTFQNAGTLLVITTTQPLQDNTIYTLYVRLKSNNHIIVKHRYENINGTLKIIDND